MTNRPHLQRGGFSLIEILFSLAILAAVAWVAGGAALMALQSERAGRPRREAAVWISTLQAQWLLGESVEAVFDETAWRGESEQLYAGDEPSEADRWRLVFFGAAGHDHVFQQAFRDPRAQDAGTLSQPPVPCHRFAQGVPIKKTEPRMSRHGRW